MKNSAHSLILFLIILTNSCSIGGGQDPYDIQPEKIKTACDFIDAMNSISMEALRIRDKDENKGKKPYEISEDDKEKINKLRANLMALSINSGVRFTRKESIECFSTEEEFVKQREEVWEEAIEYLGR